MPTNTPWRTLFVAVSTVSLLVLLLAFLALSPPQVPRTVDLRVAGPPQLTNGVLIVSVVLSNGSPRSLNVVDDTAGNPHFILDAGADYYPAGSASHVVRLGPTGNTLKVNLVPGASLTSSINVTSPPARFRLRAEMRDLAAERRHWWRGLLACVLPSRWSEKLQRRLEMPMPTTDWIEIKMHER